MQKNIFLGATLGVSLALFVVACQPSTTLKTEETPEFSTQYYVDKDGKKEGAYTKTDKKTNKIAEESVYHNDLQDGERKLYLDGYLSDVETYKNGVLEGVSKSFYPNGVLKRETNFVAGKSQGESKAYYDNKQLKEVVTFVDSEEKGAFKEFYKNGKPKAEGTYSFDRDMGEAVEEGALTMYDSLGVATKKNCVHGMCKTVE